MEYKRNAKSKFHAIYTLFHDAIIKKGFVIFGSEEVSLPKNWDDKDDIVSLKYINKDKDLITEIKALLMNDVIVVNAISNNELKTLDFNIEDHIENFDDETNTYKSKSVQNFDSKIYQDIILPLDPKPSRTSASSFERSTESDPVPPAMPDSLRDDRHYQPRLPTNPDPFAVGRGDLNPFDRRGGGMIMDPMRVRPPGIGPGWGPVPGARYDPIGPGGRGPDNDELLPPDRRNMFDHDDMFM